MLLLGVLQAQAAGGVVGAGSFDLLETQVLASNQASVTFSSLSTYAADYQHLQLRIAARTDRASYVDSAMLQFNADTASNYRAHYLIGSGSSVSSGADSQSNKIYAARVTGANGGTSVFGAGVCDILDAFSSSKNTTTKALSGYTTSSGSEIYLFSGLWMNTAALTSMRLIPNIGSNFVTGSRFSLYGIKAGA